MDENDKQPQRLMTNFEFARSKRGSRMADLFRGWLERKRSDAWWKKNCERYAVLKELYIQIFDSATEIAMPEESNDKSAEELWVYIRDEWYANSWFGGLLLTCSLPSHRSPVVQEALGGDAVAEWEVFEEDAF